MSNIVTLHATHFDELPAIADLEQGRARDYILPYSTERHRDEFKKPEMVYKSVRADGGWIGFVILVLDPDGRSVEFRRIVISKPGHGYGKQVLSMIDHICRDELNRNRIWLDVFETNTRARSLYERSGYTQFGKSELDGRKLFLFEKNL